jgi:hypothetical protein
VELDQNPGEADKAALRSAAFYVILGCLMALLGIAYQLAMAEGTGDAERIVRLHLVVGGTLSTLGGGVVGASLEDFIVRLGGSTVGERIRRILVDSRISGFQSREAELDPLRVMMHHYHVTYANGEARWLYAKFPFDTCRAVGSLRVPMILQDFSGKPHHYMAELAVRGNRLILLFTREDGTEPACSEVFPSWHSFSAAHAGWGTRQTWDTKHLTSKALISPHPLIPQKEGFVRDPVFAARLDEIWGWHFYDNYNVRNQMAAGSVLQGAAAPGAPVTAPREWPDTSRRAQTRWQRLRRSAVGLWPALLAVAGAALLAGGLLLQPTTGAGAHDARWQALVGTACNAIGAGITGATIKSLLTGKEEKLIFSAARRKLVETSAPGLATRTEEDRRRLSRLKRYDWHYYYVTAARDKAAWWYHVLPFSEAEDDDSLTVEIVIPDEHDQDHAYDVEATIRKSRLFVVFARADAGEEQTVALFPQVLNPSATQHFGVVVLESWQGPQILGRAVLSRRPLFAQTAFGAVRDPADEAELDRLWQVACDNNDHHLDFGPVGTAGNGPPNP